MLTLPEKYRGDFPLLATREGVTYLDSAATSLKPQAVIDSVVRCYTTTTANVHRSVHRLSEDATEGYENARNSMAMLLNADSREIAFVRNASEALNLVAVAVRPTGRVALSPGEHHSNLLPWREGDHF